MYKCVEGFAMAARTVPTSERLVLSCIQELLDSEIMYIPKLKC